MRTVGIIVEYNPLHNGHVYHFRQSKIASNADAAIAVISGHFLQRGEPALVHKWARAEMALRMGVDLVIELPAAYASAPAEWFAFGAVSVLESTGMVDDLCFGSELGGIEGLQHLAKQLAKEPAGFQRLVKSRLKQGVNFPTAYSGAIQSYMGSLTDKGEDKGEDRDRDRDRDKDRNGDGDEDRSQDRGKDKGENGNEDRSESENRNGDRNKNGDGNRNGDSASESANPLTQPNNILGLHYLIALERLNSRIRPLTIARNKAGYHQRDITDGQIASATAIRRLLFEQNSLEAAAPFVPPYTIEILRREWREGKTPIGWESLALPLFHAVMSRTPADLARIHEVEEGLEYRLQQAIAQLARKGPITVEALLQRLKTKRYTRTKLQRMLLRILLNHDKQMLNPGTMSQGPDYLRILGFNRRGRELLKQMKKTCKVPIVQKVSRAHSTMLEMDIRATSAYALAYRRPTPHDLLQDYYQPPLYIE